MNKWTNIIMNDGWGHPSLISTCDERLSWMIKNWIKKQLVSDNNCNIVNLYSPILCINKELHIMWGEHLASVTLYRSSQLVLSKTIRIGDTKYHIYCSLLKYTLLLMITRRFVLIKHWLSYLLIGKKKIDDLFILLTFIYFLFASDPPPHNAALWVKLNVHTIELPTSIPNCLVGWKTKRSQWLGLSFCSRRSAQVEQDVIIYLRVVCNLYGLLIFVAIHMSP